MRIIFIDRPPDSPRADLFKCTLHWQDDSTLLIAWANEIKVARIRTRPRTANSPKTNLPPLMVEVTAVFELDSMIAGIVPHPLSKPLCSVPSHQPSTKIVSSHAAPSLTSFLILAYTPQDTSLLSGNELASTHAEQARKAAERPELRIISRAGEELAADALSIAGYERWGCNDYVLVDIPSDTDEPFYVVLSPRDVVIVRPRDWQDHVAWLVERKRYEEALEEIEKRQASGETALTKGEEQIDPVAIGQKYIEYLVSESTSFQLL